MPVATLSANQFRFKKKHSTDMCKLILKNCTLPKKRSFKYINLLHIYTGSFRRMSNSFLEIH